MQLSVSYTHGSRTVTAQLAPHLASGVHPSAASVARALFFRVTFCAGGVQLAAVVLSGPLVHARRQAARICAQVAALPQASAQARPGQQSLF